MPGDLTPTKMPVDGSMEPVRPAALPKPSWDPVDEGDGIQWSRYIAALKRYKWMILMIILAGMGLGMAAARMVQPQYMANATIVLSQPAQDSRRGPIQADEIFRGVSWIDLLKTSAILDNAVRASRIYIFPAIPADTLAFQNFNVRDDFQSGGYRIRVSPDGRQWTLASSTGLPLDSGAVGDSLGRTRGFIWAPGPDVLTPSRQIDFGLAPVREVARGVLRRMQIARSRESDFINLTMVGTNPEETARTLNAVIREFVRIAGELKKGGLREVARTLERQLDTAALSLREAENKYQNFRVGTITQPSEALIVKPNDVTATPNPVFSQFYQQRLDLDNVSRDRRALQNLIAQARGGHISVDAFLAIQSVSNAQELRTALDELNRQEAALRAARVQYTDSFPTVRNLQYSIDQLRARTIPAIAGGLLQQLSAREGDLQSRVRAAEGELRTIPARTIEDARLRRDVQVKEMLYTMLKDRYEQTKLSEASAQPDVGIVDTAAVPRWPNTNSAPRIILLALMASIGGALGLAILLDHTDKRFRYPQQVTKQLGLTVIGAVPRFGTAKSTQAKHEEAAHLIEAFRSLRLGVRSQFNGGPVTLTVSSPGPGDGKSIVSLNLAMSFAEAGSRTLLIDGDIRRGQLHTTFKLSRIPGLIDLLSGEAALSEALHSGLHEKLSVIACGTRRAKGPELLTSPNLLQLMAQLRAQFDVIIVDSPPFGAGIDAYALGAATQNLLVVLRAGETDLRVAEAKLELVDRLPIRVLGAVLNHIHPDETAYKTYSYLYGYALDEDDRRPALAGKVEG